MINVSNKPISQVLLVTHPTRSEAVAAATELCKLFSKQNISVLATTDIAAQRSIKK